MRGKRVNEEILSMDIPDMTEPAIDWLNNNIKDHWNIFEWGSGASTLWFANRCNKIWSVEYFKEFYLRLLTYFEDKEVENVNLEYVAPDGAKDPEYIAKFSSAKGYSFKAFALSINKYPDEMFDMIVVDGRARNKCLHLAIPKLRSGGIIVYDDTDRLEYKREIYTVNNVFSEIISFPGKKLTTGKDSETTILRKK